MKNVNHLKKFEIPKNELKHIHGANDNFDACYSTCEGACRHFSSGKGDRLICELDCWVLCGDATFRGGEPQPFSDF